jgi:hypothetical protein
VSVCVRVCACVCTYTIACVYTIVRVCARAVCVYLHADSLEHGSGC